MPEQKSEILGKGYGNPSPNGEHIICTDLDEKTLQIVAGKVATIYLGKAKSPIAQIRYDNERHDAFHESYAFGLTQEGQMLFEGSTIESSGVHDFAPYKISFAQFVARVRDEVTWASADGPSLKQDHIVIKSMNILVPLRVIIEDYQLPERTEDTFDFEPVE